MQIVVTKTDDGKYIANVFDSRPVLMARIDVDESFSKMEEHQQYETLRVKHPEIMKRIR